MLNDTDKLKKSFAVFMYFLIPLGPCNTVQFLALFA